MLHDMILVLKRGYQLFLSIHLQNDMVIGEMENKGKQKQEAYLTGTHSVLKGVSPFPSEIEACEKNHSKLTRTER